MLGEDVVLAEEGDSPLVEVKLPVVVKNAAGQILWDRLREKVAPEVEGHTYVEEVMEDIEEMPTSVTSVTSGGTCLLNVLKVSKLHNGENMLLNPT